MRMNVCQKSHIGLVRKDNQDNMGWFSISGGELFVVADGMGGASGGRTAADIAINTIREFFEQKSGSVFDLLRISIEEANQRIYQKGNSGDPQFRKMGTTVAVLFIKNNTAYIAHVGDSRLYLYQNHNLMRLTKDHSHVQRLIDEGLIKEEDSKNHPYASMIYRSVGTKINVEVDVTPITIKIQPKDQFLICTDGLSGYVKDKEIEAIFSIAKSTDEICSKLVDSALQKGGEDNITVQVISFTETQERVSGKKNLPLMKVFLERYFRKEKHKKGWRT